MSTNLKTCCLVLFTIILILSCQAYRFRNSLNLNHDKCFEINLQRRSKSLQKTLNLINLFSFQKALSKNAKTFISFHQKSETNLIHKKEIAVKQEVENKNNDTNTTGISVYLKNKYNAEV